MWPDGSYEGFFLTFPFTARILRLLATHHMFREVAPDVFANNAISMTLDTGKPVEAILAE